MADDAFAAADLDTGLIERRHDSLFPQAGGVPDAVLALAAAALLQAAGYAGTGGRAPQAPAEPWNVADGWRVSGRHSRVFNFIDGDGAACDIELHRDDGQWRYGHGSDELAFDWTGESPTAGRCRVRIRLAGSDHSGDVLLQGERITVYRNGEAHLLRLHDAVAHAQDESSDPGGSLTAPMPGKIISVAVKAGDAVKSGDVLLVMEAMKMEHTIFAPRDGVVEELYFQPGDQVSDGAQLIALTDAA